MRASVFLRGSAQHTCSTLPAKPVAGAFAKVGCQLVDCYLAVGAQVLAQVETQRQGC